MKQIIYLDINYYLIEELKLNNIAKIFLQEKENMENFTDTVSTHIIKEFSISKKIKVLIFIT